MKLAAVRELIDKILLRFEGDTNFEVQGINLLLPYDTSDDLKRLLSLFLTGLKQCLDSPALSVDVEVLFTRKFQR